MMAASECNLRTQSKNENKDREDSEKDGGSEGDKEAKTRRAQSKDTSPVAT
jgi:hypothetical protein